MYIRGFATPNRKPAHIRKPARMCIKSPTRLPFPFNPNFSAASRKFGRRKKGQLPRLARDKSVLRLACAVQTLIQSPDFQRIFESAPSCYLVLAPGLTILAASDAYLSATMTRREEILGRGLFEVFPDDPDDPEATGECQLRTSLERVIRDKIRDTMAVQKYDIRRPRAQGGGFEVRYWSPVNFPVMKDGELDCIIHYVQDVTEYVRFKELDAERLQAGELIQRRADQMEAEVFNRAQEIQETNARLEQTIEQLHQSEEISRLILESVKEYGIFLLDTDGRIKTWTTTAQRIHGYFADEIIGKHFSVFYPREDVERGKPDRELKIAAAAGQYEEEGWRVRKDGSRIWANVLITVLRDAAGKHVGYSKITRDLTQHKIADEKLRADEAMFRGLLESAPDAMVIVDEKGGIQLSNAQATRLFGYTTEELYGQPVELLIPEAYRAVACWQEGRLYRFARRSRNGNRAGPVRPPQGRQSLSG